MARILSSDHLAKYLKGGVYYDFLQYVKNDKELAFEIRVKDEVMIYCQKNLILKIAHRKNTSDNITMLNPRYYTNRKKDEAKEPELITVKEAAETLNLSEDYVRKIKDKLPHVKQGNSKQGRLLFVKEGLMEAYLNSK